MSEVVKTEANLPSVADSMREMGIQAKDLAIPRLQLMQGTSEMVGEDKAKIGDIVNTSTNEVVGGVDKPVEIIPLMLYKTLLVEDMSSGQAKFLRQEPLTADNERLPWEDRENGIAVKRTHCFNFFCLLASEVAEDNAFPVVVRFKSSSMNAGRQLASHMFRRAALQQAPYSQAVPLGVAKMKKETNTYGVYTIGKGRVATEKELDAAKQWLPALGSMKARVDQIDDVGTDAPGVAAGFTPTVVGAEPGAEGQF